MTIFMSLGMALLMSLGMSTVMTLVNIGMSAFPWMWLRAWCIGFLVALPLSLVLPGFLRRIAKRIGIADDRIVREDPAGRRTH
ncbi:MAG: DUF2798 domain-containing protein [Candidatus Methanoplasma sp.]|nr:DUF2798 domain-containing protein [Candidatus Methanoplasma sp.]